MRNINLGTLSDGSQIFIRYDSDTDKAFIYRVTDGEETLIRQISDVDIVGISDLLNKVVQKDDSETLENGTPPVERP